MVGALLAVGAGNLSVATIAGKLALGKKELPGTLFVPVQHALCLAS